MLENIALIKEFHELLASKKAQKIADDFLSKIGLSSIGKKRLHQCNLIQIFYIMFIRALMTKDINVIIIEPLPMIDDLKEINSVLSNLELLNDKKNILILDTQINETHYKGLSCHIVK